MNVSRTRKGWEWDSEYLESGIQGPGLFLKIKGLMLVGEWASVHECWCWRLTDLSNPTSALNQGLMTLG